MAEVPKAAPFDIGMAATSDERHLFVEGAGGGIFADAIAEGKDEVETRQTRSWARETDRAVWHSFAASWRSPRRERFGRSRFDGTDQSGDFLAVEVMNIRHVGPSVPIAPDADPGDGHAWTSCS